MSDLGPLPPRKRARSSASRKTRGVKPNRKPRRMLRFALTLFAAIILSLGVYVGYLFMKVKDNIEKIAAEPPKPSSEISNYSPSLPAVKSARKQPIGFLILGLDARGDIGSLNTDVMMTAVFNPESKTATVVSIPRDSDLNLPGYRKQKANQFYAGFLSTARSKEKLTGSDARRYATDQMKQMMEKFFGVPVHYSILLDFQGFVDIVDALGGVDVYVDQNMRYWDDADGTDINLKKGEQRLNGEQALGFVRYRKSRDNLTRESSDFERNERQDRVLAALLDRLKSFESVTKIGGVLDAIGNNVKTDIPESQINQLIATYLGISRNDVRFIALTGEWISPLVHLDPDKLAEAKQALQEELQPQGRKAVPADNESESEPAQ